MTIKVHATQAAIISVPAVFFNLVNLPEGIVLFLSIIFIDVDHYFDYVFVTRRFGIRDMFRFHEFVWKHSKGIFGISLFHTVEIFGLLFFLGYLHYYFWIVLAGFIIHFALDLYSLIRHGMTFNRAFSIVEYLLRRGNNRGYPIPDETFWTGGAK